MAGAPLGTTNHTNHTNRFSPIPLTWVPTCVGMSGEGGAGWNPFVWFVRVRG